MKRIVLTDCFVGLRPPRNDTNATPSKEQGILAPYFMMSKQLGLLTLLVCIPFAGCEKQGDKTVTMDVALNPQRDFILHDQDGNIFRLKDHRGQVILLFFGYTSCPDVCPTTLSKVARLYSLVGPGARQKILTVFITIDPQRDTAQKLKEYLQYFNINAVGLTGTKQEIDAVVDSYKATYEKVVTNSSALGYMFDHTDFLYLIDEQGKTTHLFHPDDRAPDMAQIIKREFDIRF